MIKIVRGKDNESLSTIGSSPKIQVEDIITPGDNIVLRLCKIAPIKILYEINLNRINHLIQTT